MKLEGHLPVSKPVHFWSRQQTVDKIISEIFLCAVLLWAPIGGADELSLAQPCFDCHGNNGSGLDPRIPIIAGQSPYVIIDNLIAFRDGDRVCRETNYAAGDVDRAPTTMCAIATAMSEDDYEIVADFFAARDFVGRPQKTDPALVEKGRKLHDRQCEKCHTEGGSLAEDDAGMLAGQWMPYMRQAFADFRDKDRPMPEKMQAKMDKLDAQDFEALIHYYGSLGQDE